MRVGPVAKAATALLGSIGLGYWQARGADTPGGSAITGQEWQDLIVVAVMLTFGVWAVPNVARKPEVDTAIPLDVSSSHDANQGSH